MFSTSGKWSWATRPESMAELSTTLTSYILVLL
jgi:hypothetical protein